MPLSAKTQYAVYRIKTYLLDEIGQAHGQTDVEVNLAQDAPALFVRVLDRTGIREDLRRLVELRVGSVLGLLVGFFIVVRQAVLEHRHVGLLFRDFGGVDLLRHCC